MNAVPAIATDLPLPGVWERLPDSVHVVEDLLPCGAIIQTVHETVEQDKPSSKPFLKGSLLK